MLTRRSALGLLATPPLALAAKRKPEITLYHGPLRFIGVQFVYGLGDRANVVGTVENGSDVALTDIFLSFDLYSKTAVIGSTGSSIGTMLARGQWRFVAPILGVDYWTVAKIGFADFSATLPNGQRGKEDLRELPMICTPRFRKLCE